MSTAVAWDSDFEVCSRGGLSATMRRRLARLLFVGLLFGLSSPVGASSDHDMVRERVALDGISGAHAVTLYERVLGAPVAGELRVDAAAKYLIVRDTRVQVRRFAELVALLKRPGKAERRLYVRPVIHLGASELASRLEAVLASRAPGMVLVPDERSGQLIVRTTWKHYQLIDRLARRFDVPARDQGWGVRVVPGPRE